MKKRLLAVLVAIVMIISAMAVSGLVASAAEGDTYKVSYNSNSGRGTTKPHTNVAEGSEIELRECGYKKALYEFKEWNTAADGSGDSYKPGDKFTVTSAVTLYAIWQELPTVRVYYEANAEGVGGGVADNTPYVTGTECEIQSSIGYSFPEHRFKEWNTAADGTGTSYFPGDVIVLTEDLTLYAIWESLNVDIVEFTITYNANGGTGEMIDPLSPYVQGGIASIYDNEFAREGYIFDSWNTAADGSGDTYYAFDMIFSVENDITLYAQWTPENPVELTLNANGATGDDIVATYAAGETIIVPENTFVGEVEFVGWNTAADGSGTSYNAGDELVINEATTLYAIWKSDDYNPPMGSASHVAAASAFAIIALGAVALLGKKRA